MAALVFWAGYDGGSFSVQSRCTLAVAVLWAIVVGVALSPIASPPRSVLVVAALLTGLVVLDAASAFWAASAENAFAEFDRTGLYIAVFALSAFVGTKRGAARAADGVALGIVAICVLALVSRFFPHAFPSDPTQTLLPAAHSRLSYPVNYWNGLAILLALGIPLLLRIAVVEQSPVARGFALAATPALVSGIYLASSRGGWLAAAIGTTTFVALSGRWITAAAAVLVGGAASAGAIAMLNGRSDLVNIPLSASGAPGAQGRDAALLLVVLCVLTGLAWTALTILVPRVTLTPPLNAGFAALALAAMIFGLAAADPVRRFDEFKRPPGPDPAQSDYVQMHLLSSNGSGRWQFWVAAVQEFEARPLVGRGAGSYAAWWAEHGSIPAFVQDAHSLYLETLGELGVVGLALLAGAFLTGLVTAIRRVLGAAASERGLSAALTATFLAYVVAAGIDWMWELTIVSVVAMACLGLLVGPGTLSRAGAGRARIRVSVRVAIALAGCCLIVGQGLLLLSRLELSDSQAAARRGDTQAARLAAQRARDLEPWAATPYLQLGLLDEQSHHLLDARRRLGEAIERDRLDWRLWLIAARIDVERGAVKSARGDLARAVKLNPRSLLFTGYGLP